MFPDKVSVNVVEFVVPLIRVSETPVVPLACILCRRTRPSGFPGIEEILFIKNILPASDPMLKTSPALFPC